MNLYQRINEVRKSIDYIKKDKLVGTYKAVTHDQVTAMVRDHMVKQGIISYPVFVEGVMQPKDVDKDMVIAKQSRYEATYDFHFVNADEPKDELIIRIQAHAMDNADKAPGKALSYAKKYAILKLFEIETGEDDESRYSEKEEVDLPYYTKLLEDSENIADLQTNYLSAKQACLKAGDASAMKGFNAKTAQLKTKFEGAK